MSTQNIYNYMRVNENLITSGQPSEEQFQDVAAEGFQTVINLAPMEPERTLANEGALVRSLGMSYENIPVLWTNPTKEDFAAFEQAMQQHAGERILIHCVANFRVSAFYSLYAMKHLGWTESQADDFRRAIWYDSEYPIWEQFIRDLKKDITGASTP